MGFSPQQFQAMQERVRRPRRTPGPAFEAPASATPPKAEIVLGIDPSLRGTGYGVIRTARTGPQLIAWDVVKCPANWERSQCLVRIAEVIREAVQRHQPAVCVIESLFYAQNYQTALILGEARGASLVSVAGAGVPIYELAPRRVKQAIVGYGAARKEAVARMVQRLLSLPEEPPPDAADALALALTYAQEQGRLSLSPPKRL